MSIATTVTLERVLEALKDLASARVRFAQRWTRIKRKGCPLCGGEMMLKNYWLYKVILATKAVCLECGHEIVRSR